MAPKKDAGADEIDYASENPYMEKKIQVLQHRLMMKNEQIASSKKGEEDLRTRIVELDQGFKDEFEKATENTGEMSRQYREMQESFNERIEALQLHVAEAKREIEGVTHQIETVRIEKDEIIRQKNEEIKSLTHKMETMAFEFADMLKETLDKMSQRIEVTHSSWDRDSSKQPLMNRLKAFSLNNELPAKDSG